MGFRIKYLYDNKSKTYHYEYTAKEIPGFKERSEGI